MSISAGTRKQVWDGMLTADLNQRYWGYLVRRFNQYDRSVKIFVALFSTGSAVASWTIWQHHPLTWQVVSGSAAVVAIIAPFLKYPEDAGKSAALKGKWARIMTQYERLWNGLDGQAAAAVQGQLDRICERELEVSNDEAGLPDDRKLAKVCYDEVVATHTSKP